MKIGVFDSGVGGLSVAAAIRKARPDDEIMFEYDKEHFPYGGRSRQELLAFTVPILQAMAGQGCAAIVIACNTVSTNIITELRAKLAVPLIAVEPMVKPAAEHTKSGTIAICATTGTLASPRYAELKQLYANGLRVLEPDCSAWAGMIETNQLDHQKIRSQIEALCDAGADVIVLGCTHYHWIENEVRAMAQGRALVIQPEPAIVAQLNRVLARVS